MALCIQEDWKCKVMEKVKIELTWNTSLTVYIMEWKLADCSCLKCISFVYFHFTKH